LKYVTQPAHVEKRNRNILPAAGKIVLKSYLMAGIVPDKF
jgi:hypothetical protein